MSLLESCKQIEDAIWNGEPLPSGRELQSFSNGRIKGIDSTDGKFRFIQQNPLKDSDFARRAQYGAHIIWIFKDDTYFARYEDGKLISI